MAISPKTTKLLWASAAGLCSFEMCRERLCIIEAGEHAPYTLGEMAHICGEKPGSNRHDPGQSSTQRDNYSNLILLCPTHHALIDKKENEAKYTVDLLQHIKAGHEKFVLENLKQLKPRNKNEASKQILPLLTENHAAWKNFGPLSETAKKNPHSDEVHAIWISERLSIIVPNNRRIAQILDVSRHLFDGDDQSILSAFLVHMRSYERWVNDEIPYAGVVRFPIAFSDLIKEYTNAS